MIGREERKIKCNGRNELRGVVDSLPMVSTSPVNMSIGELQNSPPDSTVVFNVAAQSSLVFTFRGFD